MKKAEKIPTTPLEVLLSIVVIIVGIFFLITLFGQLIIIKIPIDSNAIVYVNEETQIYYAPPYILGAKYPPGLDVSNIKAMTLAEAEKKNYKADEQCEDRGYFTIKNTLKDTIFLKLGFIEPSSPRLNEDGSWNW